MSSLAVRVPRHLWRSGSSNLQKTPEQPRHCLSRAEQDDLLSQAQKAGNCGRPVKYDPVSYGRCCDQTRPLAYKRGTIEKPSKLFTAAPRWVRMK
jgi:hypothetical protein